EPVHVPAQRARGDAEPLGEFRARPEPVVLQEGEQAERAGAGVRHDSDSASHCGQELTAMAPSMDFVRQSSPIDPELRERRKLMTSGTFGDTTALTGERADLLATLAKSRHFLRFTSRDLDDDQARQRTTVSELTIGGLIKHVTAVERNWASFIVHGPATSPDFSAMSEADFKVWAEGFQLLPSETLAGVLAEYAEVAKHTDELVATLPDL